MTRGERLNNPCCIDYEKASAWLGQVGIETGVPEPRFCQFDSAVHGIRAAAKLLLNHYRNGKRTLVALISAWAPPAENDTSAYIAAVSQEIGTVPTDLLTLTVPTVTAIIAALIRHENGRCIYSELAMETGVRAAFFGNPR